MSTLTKIVSLAKKLKKQAPNKFAKWTDYIKEASAKIKPVVKKAKKVAKKVTKKVKKTYKKHLGETHTDTNSHNVKLSIYSGTGLRKNENTLSYAKAKTKKYISGFDSSTLLLQIKNYQNIINMLRKELRTALPEHKKIIKDDINSAKKLLLVKKRILLNELKKIK
jgi:F0F1-type ATP synthase membrane subunit b/b'